MAEGGSFQETGRFAEIYAGPSPAIFFNRGSLETEIVFVFFDQGFKSKRKNEHNVVWSKMRDGGCIQVTKKQTWMICG